MEASEWLGNLTSKSIDRFVVETVRKRARKLLASKGLRRQAIRNAKSRKGPWHMAKTKTSGVGMTNAWLAEQGVLSLKSLWAELAHLCGTARGADPHAVLVWGGWSGNGHSYPIYVGFVTGPVHKNRSVRIKPPWILASDDARVSAVKPNSSR